jgi:hypothetical protein
MPATAVEKQGVFGSMPTALPAARQESPRAFPGLSHIILNRYGAYRPKTSNKQCNSDHPPRSQSRSPLQGALSWPAPAAFILCWPACKCGQISCENLAAVLLDRHAVSFPFHLFHQATHNKHLKNTHPPTPPSKTTFGLVLLPTAPCPANQRSARPIPAPSTLSPCTPAYPSYAQTSLSSYRATSTTTPGSRGDPE